MVQAMDSRLNMSGTDAMRLAELQDPKYSAASQRAKEAELPPKSLCPEGMPISCQASHHKPEDKQDLALETAPSATSPTRTQGVSAIPQPASDRRDSAGLEELERKSRKHSSTISVDSATPEVNRSNWPLLYQIIDVDPNTAASEFAEVARR